jgi:N utilization substance protein B
MSNQDVPGRPRPRTGRRKTGTGSAKARRKAARLSAVQALYQIDMTGTATEAVIGEFVKLRLGQEIDGATFVAADPQLFAGIVRGTGLRREEVDSILTAALDSRLPLERLESLLRAIMRAGTYELFAHRDTHPRIVISEYVDVAHAFFAGREPGMVNGVLDNVARSLRGDEIDQPDPARAQPD